MQANKLNQVSYVLNNLDANHIGNLINWYYTKSATINLCFFFGFIACLFVGVLLSLQLKEKMDDDAMPWVLGISAGVALWVIIFPVLIDNIITFFAPQYWLLGQILNNLP